MTYGDAQTQEEHDQQRIRGLAEVLHRVKAVGGPWAPCDMDGPCDCMSMAIHVLEEAHHSGWVFVRAETWMVTGLALKEKP